MVEIFYTATGKYYRNGAKQALPSAGMICTALTKETYDYVGIQSLERAMHHGEGAHKVACDYSLFVLGHLSGVELPPMPAECPLTTPRSWAAAMQLALEQVQVLFNKYEVEPIAVEEPGICSSYGFGGQPDIKLRMTWRKKRRIVVWDYKRVAKLSQAHRLKIGCYLMLDEYKDCEAGFLTWLKQEGQAELVPVPTEPGDRAAICGQAAAFNWQLSKRVLVP